jgi:hypothetical protein
MNETRFFLNTREIFFEEKEQYDRDKSYPLSHLIPEREIKFVPELAHKKVLQRKLVSHIQI